MKKLLLLILPVFVALLIFVPLTSAQENIRKGEVATLFKDETMNKDYFSSGEKVTLSGTVNGDAYLAGGDVVVDGTVNGDLIVIGGNLLVNGNVTGDVRAAGGNVNIDGEIGGNVTAAGGNVRIDDDASITGSVVAGAGNAEFLGPIGKGITAGAGSLKIGNQVGSDVMLGVGQLDLVNGAVVNGNLFYISEETAGISEGATVSGKVTHRIPPKEKMQDTQRQLMAGAKAGVSIYGFLTSLVFGLIMIFAFPNYTKNTAVTILKRPWAAMGIGFLALIVIPILAVVLMITIIGIPFGLALLAGYIFLMLFASVITAMAIGHRILDPKIHAFWALLLGLVILTVIGIIPIIGGIVQFLALLAGMGALLITKKSTYSMLRSKKHL